MFVYLYNKSQEIRKIRNIFKHTYYNIKFNNGLNSSVNLFMKDDELNRYIIKDFIYFVKNNKLSSNKYILNKNGESVSINICNDDILEFRVFKDNIESLCFKYLLTKNGVDISAYDRDSYHTMHCTLDTDNSKDDISDIVYLTKKYMVKVLKEEIYEGRW